MIGYFLLAINLIAFGCFGIDKFKAISGRWRIPEKYLLLLAIGGGSLGAIMGMIIFNHKVNKMRFKWGIPLIMLVQVLVIWISFRV